MDFHLASEKIKIIKLVRSNIIPKESIQHMRTHVKSLIIEANQENPDDDYMDGAIKVVALIDSCIRELSNFEINYFQGPKIGRALVRDQVNGESAFVDIKDEEDIKKKKKSKYAKAIIPRNVVVSVDVDDKTLEETKQPVEFATPFSSKIDSSDLDCNDNIVSKDAVFINPFEEIYADSTLSDVCES
ncbi:9448_t:CDS:2 [Acaulospora morrowiae]|uniref:9448_t:CDS:1 n=1 Tax=Acaulospora morrowiae TaxID=94023 RepID=A0A9N8YNP6_9GLOM|nr:9448_t:CDS:2 [Acaulospora morrowiae]